MKQKTIVTGYSVGSIIAIESIFRNATIGKVGIVTKVTKCRVFADIINTRTGEFEVFSIGDKRQSFCVDKSNVVKVFDSVEQANAYKQVQVMTTKLIEDFGLAVNGGLAVGVAKPAAEVYEQSSSLQADVFALLEKHGLMDFIDLMGGL